MDYVEAFVLQIGQREQHKKILSLLSSMDRAFSNGKIAYKPPGERQLTSVLDVARGKVGQQVNLRRSRPQGGERRHLWADRDETREKPREFLRSPDAPRACRRCTLTDA